MEYIFPILRIPAATSMDDEGSLEEILTQLVQFEEYHFIVEFHQQVEKDFQKAWHDRHIKSKYFQWGDPILLYDNKFVKHPSKLQMHWLGPYVIHFITDKGAV